MSFWSKSLLILSLLALPLANAWAAEDCSCAAIKANTDKAAEIIKAKGQAGLEEVKAMRYCNGEGYMYVADLNGVVLMHPVAPHLLGKNSISLKDVNGKLFVVEMIEKVNKTGEAWYTYSWPKPGQKTPSDKCGYAKKTTMDGKDVTVASGLYDIAPDKCGQ